MQSLIDRMIEIIEPFEGHIEGDDARKIVTALCETHLIAPKITFDGEKNMVTTKSVLSSLSETYALVPLKVCRAAKEALHGVIGLIDESRGVVGWHLNGNEASWSEFNYPEELDRVVEQLYKCLPEEEASR